MTSTHPLDRPTPDLVDALVQTSFEVLARLTEVAATHDLSLTQLRVLAILRDREPRMADLASYLALDRSSVSGLVDRAEARGLVRRRSSSDDGRVVRVGLTRSGRALARVGAEQSREALRPMTDGLDEAARLHLTALLGGIGEAAPLVPPG